MQQQRQMAVPVQPVRKRPMEAVLTWWAQDTGMWGAGYGRFTAGVNPLLWKAIEERRLIRVRYNNRERIIEPHDYGVHKGVVKLLAYQVAGSSKHKLPNWRWLEEDSMSDIELLNERFGGGRPSDSGEHHRWEKLFIRVRPDDKRRK